MAVRLRQPRPPERSAHARPAAADGRAELSDALGEDPMCCSSGRSARGISISGSCRCGRLPTRRWPRNWRSCGCCGRRGARGLAGDAPRGGAARPRPPAAVERDERGRRRVARHAWTSCGTRWTADTALLSFVWSEGRMVCLVVTADHRAGDRASRRGDAAHAVLAGLRSDLDMSASVRAGPLADVVRQSLDDRLRILSDALLARSGRRRPAPDDSSSPRRAC